MASVYIETTIPSYHYETRTTAQVMAWREATRLWWGRNRDRYDSYTSRGVKSELSRSPEPEASQTLALIAPIPVLDEPPGVAEVVEYYLEHRLVPGGKADSDAYHLALASMRSMDFLFNVELPTLGERQ